MRFAIIKNGKVVNIAVSNYPLTSEWAQIPVGCPVGIGDTFKDGVFYSPDGVMRMTPEVAMIYKMFAKTEETE